MSAMNIGQGAAPVLPAAAVTAVSEVGNMAAMKAALPDRSPRSAPDNPAGGGSTQVTFSALALQLSRWLSSSAAPLSALVASQPVLAVPMADARHTCHAYQLAAALRHSLENCGLFYESHLLQWHSGQRELSSLCAEPQAASAASTADSMPQEDAMLAIVRSQLDMLDTARIRWEGELWPGMPLRWELQKEILEGGADKADYPKEAPPDADQPAWTSTLQLKLPALGNISAELSLRDQSVQSMQTVQTVQMVRIRLVAAEGQAASQLDDCRQQLADGLGSAGILLETFSVHRDEGS